MKLLILWLILCGFPVPQVHFSSAVLISLLQPLNPASLNVCLPHNQYPTSGPIFYNKVKTKLSTLCCVYFSLGLQLWSFWPLFQKVCLVQKQHCTSRKEHLTDSETWWWQHNAFLQLELGPYSQIPLNMSPLCYISATPAEVIGFTLVCVLIPTRSGALRICSIPAPAVRSPPAQICRTSISGW